MGDAVDQIELEGLRVAYVRAGAGPPLLLLHGLVGDSRDWRRQLEDLFALSPVRGRRGEVVRA